MTGSDSMATDLKIETVTEGNGATASTGNRVSVHYKGMLSDGDVFDASGPRGKPFSFEIGAGQVIRGWEQGVSGMKVGEVRKLTIPPKLGYGSRGAGDTIPPNATLIFEIELLDVSAPVTLGQANPELFKRAQMDGAIIIDIRREDEWTATGVIEGAITITAFGESGTIHPEFQEKFLNIAPSQNTPIMLYCHIGGRTTSLGNALINQLGYTNVSHLTDGIVGWLADGNQIVTYED
ncbi:FKBP-type peptidyl-prolyl cis-trans isomerase [Candidatus Puniceispirillum sp.]|nr:FKBP-type peptidyl-prolyl cis-trans isomerase [Candidatus Puniceispirillum sp.]